MTGSSTDRLKSLMYLLTLDNEFTSQKRQPTLTRAKKPSIAFHLLLGSFATNAGLLSPIAVLLVISFIVHIPSKQSSNSYLN